MTTALWGGRFAGGLDPFFDAFNKSLGFDRRLLADDLRGSLAWARALGDAGVLSEGEADELAAAIEALGSDLANDPSALDTSAAEDVHSFVESALAERVGALAKKLHTGRSRNDQVATDLKLYLARAVPELDAALRDLIRALVDLAERTHALPLPGYTHLQRAQPITAGHHALAYVEMLVRDRSRFADALTRMETCPLGSGALAGTAFPVDRAALSERLGFAGGPTRNSLDAVSDRDHAIELVFACSLCLVHLSRLAEDWIFFATQEAGFLRFSDAVSTGSSLMPQKKNPDAMELVRGKTGRVLGALHGLLVTVKGLPLAYDKDMQEDKEALFDALDTTLACVKVATLCVRHAEYDESRCRAACETGFLNATDLADLLVAAGVPFRDAHERVGAAVRQALEDGVELTGLSTDRRKELFPELTGDLAESLRTAAVLARRDVVGGTAPTRVRAAVQDWKKELGDMAELTLRKAATTDAGAILELVNGLAKDQIMLPRSPAAVIENIRDFIVAEVDGAFAGCGALHIVWADLGEIRSIAVAKEHQKLGLGKLMVERLIEDAEELSLAKVFAFTYVAGFFEKLGFSVVEHASLPHKVFQDCLNCPKFQSCDEIAVERVLRETTEEHARDPLSRLIPGLPLPRVD